MMAVEAMIKKVNIVISTMISLVVVGLVGSMRERDNFVSF